MPQPQLPSAFRKRYQPNWMLFPQPLRSAIPNWPDSARTLNLTAIDGSSSNTVEFGQTVKLDFRLEESGKLDGVFTVSAGFDLDAARALAASLKDLIEQAERTPPTRLSVDGVIRIFTHK
jgi:hypothetical protein